MRDSRESLVIMPYFPPPVNSIEILIYFPENVFRVFHSSRKSIIIGALNA